MTLFDSMQDPLFDREQVLVERLTVPFHPLRIRSPISDPESREVMIADGTEIDSDVNARSSLVMIRLILFFHHDLLCLLLPLTSPDSANVDLDCAPIHKYPDLDRDDDEEEYHETVIKMNFFSLISYRAYHRMFFH